MKTLYLIGGTMGVGKTTVSQILKKRLPNAVYLDGDWCWDASPFQVTEETKAMVLDNICHLLSNFLRCSAYENIVFSWVLHEQTIIDTILERLPLSDCRIRNISLICNERNLKSRLRQDISAGIRTADIVERSLARLPLYSRLHTEKVDTNGKSAEKVANIILLKAPYGEIVFDPKEFLIENGVLLKYLGRGGDIVIPDGVKMIAMDAFDEDTKIRTLTIPDSVTIIDDYTFNALDDQHIQRISIGKGVVEIGKEAFLSFWNVDRFECERACLSHFMRSGFGGFCFYPFHTVFRNPSILSEDELRECIEGFRAHSLEDIEEYLKHVTPAEIHFLEKHALIPPGEEDIWCDILHQYGNAECEEAIRWCFVEKDLYDDCSDDIFDESDDL